MTGAGAGPDFWACEHPTVDVQTDIVPNLYLWII